MNIFTDTDSNPGMDFSSGSILLVCSLLYIFIHKNSSTGEFTAMQPAPV